MYLQHASEKAERASEGVGWGKGQRGFKNLSGMYRTFMKKSKGFSGTLEGPEKE